MDFNRSSFCHRILIFLNHQWPSHHQPKAFIDPKTNPHIVWSVKRLKSNFGGVQYYPTKPHTVTQLPVDVLHSAGDWEWWYHRWLANIGDYINWPTKTDHHWSFILHIPIPVQCMASHMQFHYQEFKHIHHHRIIVRQPTNAPSIL